MEQRSIRKAVVIGRGHVGTHLVGLFREKNVLVEWVGGREMGRKIEELVLLDSSDVLWLLAIKDEAYADVISILPAGLKGVVVHTSGTLPLRLLYKFSRRGVFYPFQTFRKEVALVRKDFLIVVESDDDCVREELMELAFLLTGHALAEEEDFRQRLHVAGVLASNFINYLAAKAWEWLKGYSPDLIRDALVPLMLQTVERMREGDPDALQTGPAARNDRNILIRHLHLLQNNPELYEIYVFLTNRILKHYGYPELPK